MQPDKQTWQVLGFSLALSASLAAAFAYLRSGIGWPFEVRVFQHLSLYQDYYTIVPYVAILLLGLLPSMRQAGIGVARWISRNVWWVALGATAAFAIGTQVVYHAHTLSLDEYLVLFQSKIFAQGKLAGQFPPQLMDWLVPVDFRGKFIVVAENGAVASAYWPGFSLLLLPFEALGLPWLLNPLIGGATLLIAHRIALRLFGSAESAGLVVLLTLGSQAVCINALSFYTMPAHLLANGLFMLLLLSPSPARALFAGLVGSCALVLHNPLPHLLFALPWIVWQGFRPERSSLLPALAAGYLPIGLALGWGWAIFLASLERGTSMSELATPGEAVRIFLDRLGAVSNWAHGSLIEMRTLDFGKLWLWSSPALVPAAVLGAMQAWRERSPWDPVIGAVVLTYAAYSLMPFAQGHGWGYRYFHPAWLMLPLLAAGAARGAARSALPGYLAACALLSLAILTSLRTLQVEQFIARHLAQGPAAESATARLVFVNPQTGYYSWDLVQNDPFLRNRIVMLYSQGMPADRALVSAQFPNYELQSFDARGSVWGSARR